MDKQQLERAADKLETVLAVNHAPAVVTGGHVTPRCIQFNLSTSGKRAGDVESLTTEIASALGVPYATITRSGSAVRIDVPRNDPQPIALDKMIKRIPRDRVPECTALCGLAEDGAPLLARLPADNVGHVLITGPAGSGKTSLIIAMLLSLTYYNQPRHVKIVAMGSGLRDLCGLPHMLEVDELARLLERRSTDPRIIVAIDEPRKGDLPLLRAMVERGAAAGIHCIVAAREPFDLQVKVKITADHTLGDCWAEYNGQVIRFDAAHIGAHEIGSFVQHFLER